MKIPRTELSSDALFRCVIVLHLDGVGGCIYSKVITLKRITSTLFMLYAFSNQFSLIKVTINKQVVRQYKWYHRCKKLECGQKMSSTILGSSQWQDRAPILKPERDQLARRSALGRNSTILLKLF